MKNTLQGIHSRLKAVEQRISNLQEKVGKSNQTEQQKKEVFKEERLRDLCHNFKQNNIHIIGFPEGEERGRKPV